jgi:hypothetical protein
VIHSRVTQRPTIRLPIIYITMTDNYSLDTEYISIYERPKRTKQTPEEKAQKNRDNVARYYNNNYEYCVLKHRLYAQLRYDKIGKQKTTIDG